MKKVLFFIRSLNSGGAERQLVVTARGLAERGYKVTVLTFYSGGYYADELSTTKVRLLSLHKKGRWDLVAFFFRLIVVLRTEAPDSMYSFLGTANILSILSRPFAPPTRTVLGVRASSIDLDQYDWVARWSYWVECRLARFADHVIVNSHAGLNYAVAHGFPESKMVVISNGIDTEYFRPDKVSGVRVRKAWGVGKDEQLIGLVGRIDPMKDHVTFLKAAALIKRELSNVRFVCVGKGEIEYENAMHKLATEMNLDDVLIWAGICSNMMEVYNALDITSSSSSSEGFSNVIGESMACGVPCVVTNVGDSALVVGQAGLVVLPNDSGALCSAWCEMLLLEVTEPRVMSVAARDRIISQFSISTLLDFTEQVLGQEDANTLNSCHEGTTSSKIDTDR
jgi:glycosyltransferase involved in cell wall biosynthesis